MKQIDDALGLNPMSIVYEEKLPTELETTIEEDIELARDNTYAGIKIVQQAIQDMMSIAQQSQASKDYSELNSLVKTFADLSNSLIDIQTKKKRLLGTTETTPNVTNNLIITTAELQRMIADAKK